MDTLHDSLAGIVRHTRHSEKAPELFAAFAREEWDRLSAWETLHRANPHQIWRKCHSGTHWCWYARPGEKWDKEKQQLVIES